MPYDLAIPLLSINLKNIRSLSQRNVYIPLLNEILFTIGHGNNCPLTDKRIRERCGMYIIGILFSHKKEGNLAICDSMAGPSGDYAK